MEQILALMPKRKLTREDFRNDTYIQLKKKADREASLPPEHVPLINRMDLLGTLHATRKAMKENFASLNAPGRNEVQILWPQIYSSAKLEDLSRCAFYISV